MEPSRRHPNRETPIAEKKKRNPRLILAACGCAQAEVVPRLTANLIHHPEIGDHEVIVVATEAALEFFDRKPIEKLTGRPVFVHHRDATAEFNVPHINLAEWAEGIIVYPASTNTIAKCAAGLCDNLLTTVILAARCPIYFGPTMNDRMYEHPATQRNLKTLEKLGYKLIPREMTSVVIHATQEMKEKMYCSESMVLNVCEEMF